MRTLGSHLGLLRCAAGKSGLELAREIIAETKAAPRTGAAAGTAADRGGVDGSFKADAEPTPIPTPPTASPPPTTTSSSPTPASSSALTLPCESYLERRLLLLARAAPRCVVTLVLDAKRVESHGTWLLLQSSGICFRIEQLRENGATPHPLPSLTDGSGCVR